MPSAWRTESSILLPFFGYARWRPKPRVYRALINTLLQLGVIGRPAVLNRFSGFHRPKPLKRLRFNGLACTQLKQGVNETCRPRCSKSGIRPPARRRPSAARSAKSAHCRKPKERGCGQGRSRSASHPGGHADLSEALLPWSTLRLVLRTQSRSKNSTIVVRNLSVPSRSRTVAKACVMPTSGESLRLLHKIGDVLLQSEPRSMSGMRMRVSGTLFQA